MKRLIYLCAMMGGLLSSCVTIDAPEVLPPMGPDRCDFLKNKINWEQAVGVLNQVSDLFHNSCFRDTIAIGSKIREKFRHKTYSLTKETAEIFLAEGAVTDYVLESYERGYLSFLISMSYIKLNQVSAARVELNKFYNEEIAPLYNRGQDPVNALLQATLWDKYPREGFSSRPFWFWLTKADGASLELRSFARTRVQEIDIKKGSGDWQVAEVGQFPEIDWSIQFTSSTSGYFNIRPKRAFPKFCADDSGMIVPTSTWFHKIAKRHSHDYHPLVNVKSWIRLPIGVAYGITTAATGASIMFGGCALDAVNKGDGALCHISIRGGVAVMAQTDDVIDYALSPDLRHWEKVPAAIFLSRNRAASNKGCYQKAKEFGVRNIL